MSDQRNALRAQIFGAENRKPKSKTITLFGAQVEIRQPTLEQILLAREEPDQKRAMLRMLIDFTYVPGTDERVFEEADFDAIFSMPFGTDLGRANDALNELTGINIEGAEGNSAGIAASA